jgi:hypothetical protein
VNNDAAETVTLAAEPVDEMERTSVSRAVLVTKTRFDMKATTNSLPALSMLLATHAWLTPQGDSFAGHEHV